MRKTKYTFFLILLFLTAVLTFIIVGEGDNYSDPAAMTSVVEEVDIPVLDQADMMIQYQNVLSNILYNYQQNIAQQSMTREQAIAEIREQVLAIAQIPTDMQQLHLNLVIALSRDLSGHVDEAAKVYVELQSEYKWLYSRFNFLMQ